MPWVKTKDMFFSALFKVTQISPTVQFVKNQSQNKSRCISLKKWKHIHEKQCYIHTYTYIYIYIMCIEHLGQTAHMDGQVLILKILVADYQKLGQGRVVYLIIGHLL